MSDTSPFQSVPDLPEITFPPAIGWVVHEVVGKPQATQNKEHWAWCKVEADRPGYVEIVFTEADGVTQADPYPQGSAPTPRPVRLGRVITKMFC